MKYVSTRDHNPSPTKFSFEEALCSGYAPDGGLFVPYLISSLNDNDNDNTDDVVCQPIDLSCDWKGLSKIVSYSELMCTILSKFVTPDIPIEDLKEICNNSLSISSSSPASDAAAGINKNEIPIPVVQPCRQDNVDKTKIFIGELFHGPTYCFKDFGLRVVVGMLSYFATKRQRPITLVVATTGDTGPAAVQAVQDISSSASKSAKQKSDDSTPPKHPISIVVHFPKGQISEFQKRQLTTADAPNIKIVEFEGGGDDMDVPIKNLVNTTKGGGDDTSVDKRLLCGINSYNIGRPLIQMVHFIWIYLRVVEQLGIEPGDKDFVLDIVIPTGAMGNLAGAYMAKKLLGLPLGKLNSGVNINDFTNTMFQTGRYDITATEMKRTLSEAINIQLPYNLERVLFYLTNQNHEQIKEWYTSLEASKVQGRTDTVTIGSEWLDMLQKEFNSARVTDKELCQTIQIVHKKWNYWADPHTGVAICAAMKLGYIPELDGNKTSTEKDGDGTTKNSAVAIIATASPCKFQQAMTTALGEDLWKEYEDKLFPSEGMEILKKAETPNLLYKSNPSMTFKENQKEWEIRSRNMIYNEL